MNKRAVFSDKTVFISGAAGGLGKVLVKEYAEAGFQVFAADIETSGLSIFSGLANVVRINLDVTDLDQVKSLASDLQTDKRGLDILICLAGIYNTYPVTEADPCLLEKIMAVNFLGTASLVQCFLKPLIRNKGRVIVVSSESYKVQALFQPYMISKAGLEAYCRVARQELALKGVKLVVIRPGAIRTPLLKWMESPGEAVKYPVFSQELKRSWSQSVKMVGNISEPDEVARKIFNASIASKPKRIYRVNNNALLILISLLPPWILDRIIIKRFRMKE